MFRRNDKHRQRGVFDGTNLLLEKLREILKSGFGWSDRELHEQLCFNLQVCHAVGMGDLGEEVFELRTLYNFRRRVREHAEETGEDLFEEVFQQVTDAQLEAVGTEAEWQRIDSTQVMSNVAEQSRLELIISVVQKLLAERMRPAAWVGTSGCHESRNRQSTKRLRRFPHSSEQLTVFIPTRDRSGLGKNEHLCPRRAVCALAEHNS